MASLFWLIFTQNKIKNNELTVILICLWCMVLKDGFPNHNNLNNLTLPGKSSSSSNLSS